MLRAIDEMDDSCLGDTTIDRRPLVPIITRLMGHRVHSLLISLGSVGMRGDMWHGEYLYLRAMCHNDSETYMWKACLRRNHWNFFMGIGLLICSTREWNWMMDFTSGRPPYLQAAVRGLA